MNAALERSIPLNSWIFVFAAVAATFASIQIWDFVEFPFESTFGSISVSGALSGLVSALFALGYVGLFILMFLENVSLPIPSEVVLPLAGYLIYTGRMTFPLALGVATLAGIVGALAAYYIAYLLGRPLVYGIAKRFGVDENKLIRSESWLNGRGGSIFILVARFVPGIRSSISLPAGVLKMNLWKFSVMTLIGSLGWSALLIYAGFSTGKYWMSGAQAFSNGVNAVLPYAVLVGSLLYLGYFLTTKSRMLSNPKN